MNRKYLKLSVILFLAAVGLVFCNKCTSKRGENSETLTLKQAIDNIVLPRLKVGAIIGVILRNQRHVFAYGAKERNGSEAPDSNTVFEIGSNTKTFTAVILADMHLEGNVNLEDNVEIYHPAEKVTIPGSNGTKINLTHLATHTSGIPSMPGNVEEHQANPGDPFSTYTVDHMYEFLNTCTLAFPVGSRHQYSNAGMGLLGLTLALANGTSYEELLNQRLLNPLGMNNTTLFITDGQRQNLATGYDDDLNPVSTWTATDCLQGAGLIKSTLNDMFIYLEANMGLLDHPLRQAMDLAHEQRVKAPWGEYCGLGWYTAKFEDGQEILNHNGATGGYYAYIGFNKSLGTGVIVLCNNKYDSGSDEIGPGILKILKDY
jgi:D-alanyl-D-alanine-carboxypeptidase/D-alanyl-D-alanine-endopeptidase